jgi:hypothetical protein
MTLAPDHGIGIAVFTNRSPNAVPGTLTWHVLDRLRGREPIDWRARSRKQRDEFLAHMQTAKGAREKARHRNTRPAHELAAYAGDYAHPAYGGMSEGRGRRLAMVVARRGRGPDPPSLRNVRKRPRRWTATCRTGLPSPS